jgi:hypothetical protein
MHHPPDHANGSNGHHDEPVLTPAQRLDLAVFSGLQDDADLSDAELLARFAEHIDMTGELAVDPDGVLELERDDILVALETVPEDDRAFADHPDLLHLSIMLRPASDEELQRLEQAELLDPGEDRHGEAEDWIFAWWGSLCTNIPRDAAISRQLLALNRVMDDARRVVERGSIGDFFDRLQDLRIDDDLDDEIEVEIYTEDDDGDAR